MINWDAIMVSLSCTYNLFFLNSWKILLQQTRVSSKKKTHAWRSHREVRSKSSKTFIRSKLYESANRTKTTKDSVLQIIIWKRDIILQVAEENIHFVLLCCFVFIYYNNNIHLLIQCQIRYMYENFEYTLAFQIRFFVINNIGVTDK